MTDPARSVLVTILAICALALSACGQRGPLNMPDEAPAEVRQPTPPATPAPAENPAPKKGKDTEREPDEKPR